MPKRVLCLIIGSQRGAGMTTLLSLMRGFDSMGFVVVTQEKGPLTDELDKLGVKYYVMKMRGVRKFKYLIHNLIAINKLLNIARLENIGSVYCVQWRLNPYMIAVSKCLKIPSICHVHDVLNKENIIKRFRLDRADKIVVPSGAAKKFFDDNHLKAEIIHCGVDLNVFNKNISLNNVREEFSIKTNEILIGTVARFTPLKGLVDFIRMAAYLNQRFESLKFMICGDDVWNTGVTRESLKQIAFKNRVDNICFIGERNDIPAVLAAMDIFILSSWTESFSLAVIEAMAMCKPVAATLCGGPEEIISDAVNGFLVPVKKPGAMSDAVARLIENKELRQQIAYNGYQTVVERFSLENYVRSMRRLFFMDTSISDLKEVWDGRSLGRVTEPE